MVVERVSISYEKELVNQIDKINEEYISISKWLIGLSTGAIVFITGMLSPTGFWKWELAAGLLSLVISILLGIKFVTLIIDKGFFQFGTSLTRRYLDFFKDKDLESEYEFESKTQKVKDIVGDLVKDCSDWEGDIKRMRKGHVSCFSWQKRLFYIGIVLVALFGLFHI